MSIKRFVTISDVNNALPECSLLTAIEFIYKSNSKGKKSRYVKCVCKCGTISDMSVDSVTTHKSCGCIRIALFKKMATKYYPVIPKLRSCYNAMIDRCYNPKNKRYKKYGAIGVIVCDEWLNDYTSFLNWAVSNGYDSSLCLDKDIKGDGKLYSPQTCCWITNAENQKHKSNTVRYFLNDKFLTLGEISIITGITQAQLKNRLAYPGTSIEQAIFLIKNKINRRYEK